MYVSLYVCLYNIMKYIQYMCVYIRTEVTPRDPAGFEAAAPPPNAIPTLSLGIRFHIAVMALGMAVTSGNHWVKPRGRHDKSPR